ncbi:MAG: type II secretion system F family protein [Nanoarchaeota archaeon]|nr:type II secretion system F family protein [Nanoarchaeota archaeon]
MNDIKVLAKRIETLAQEIKKYRENKKKFLESVEEFKKTHPNEKDYKEKLNIFLKGRTIEAWTSYFDSYISQSFNEIEAKTDEIANQLTQKETAMPIEQQPIFYLSKKEEKKYKEELRIDEEYIERLRPEESKELLILKDYTVYEANPYGKLANSFVEEYSEKLIKSMPKMYENLVHALRTSDTKILSKTYVSMMLFTAIIVSFVTLLTALLISLFGAEITIFKIIQTIFQSITLSAVAGIATLAVFFFIPVSQANTRRRQIKNDLPFVIIHMAAVAGSGAHPISMFNLLFSSGEYKGLEGEIKKIINYVNLFGYNLSTALRTVALTTPSEEFRELLLGLVTTIETGGSLKDYLTAKADEAMVNYRLERKKYIEILATYADVYTGILIAAPLLFFVTLAIIQMMGGAIMGLSVNIIATVGTYAILPLLNMAFIVFLNFTQPE